MRNLGLRSTTTKIMCLLAIALITSGAAQAQTLERCFSSPFLKSVCDPSTPNFEGRLVHARWEAEASKKLNTFVTGNGNKRPNILVIYVDDMGWGDPGVYGGGTALGAATPNIDRLASLGLRMTSAYSQPSCTPTRAAWQTGRLPQRTGLTRPTAAGEASSGMGDQLTIAEVLTDAGYMTGMTGKWHLGEEEGTMWPTDVGYQEYYGNLGVNTAYHDWRDPTFSPELVYDASRRRAMENLDFVKTTIMSYADDTPTRFIEEIDLDCNDVDTGVEDPTGCEQKLEQKYLAWSKDFMQRASNATTPFFLYHAMNKVHTKNHPSDQYRGKSVAGTPFRDGIMEIDQVVGDLVKHLRDIGELQNTFIFFTSDNGAEEDVHAGGINTSDSGHHPWRGAKGTTWEGGVRVSAIAVWPGMIKAGRVSDGLFDHMDLFNTLARLGGVDVATTYASTLDGHYIDGIDQTAWLLTHAEFDPMTDVETREEHDPQRISNREAIYYWYGQQFYGVRWAEFKRLERIMNVGMSVGPQTYGGLFNATMSETSDPSLGWYFNLYSDPKERMPITRTWNIGTLNELSTHSKKTFVDYPEAPRGVVINGYIIGGQAGGTIHPNALKKLADLLDDEMITHASMPD